LIHFKREANTIDKAIEQEGNDAHEATTLIMLAHDCKRHGTYVANNNIKGSR